MSAADQHGRPAVRLHDPELKLCHWRGEQDQDVPTADRLDVGDVPATRRSSRPTELGRLALDLGR